MAGLLDGLFGDTETKDEYGQTQADRRQPVWDGLIKAGLLAYAGGGRVDPNTRAQMYAQAGGAIGDITTGQQQQQQFAQQTLMRKQALATSKSKLDNIAKLQAIAKTPEFLDSIKDLKPHEKIAMQAAIDAGDIDAFTKVTGQVGTSEHKARQLELSQQRADILATSEAHRREKQLFDIDKAKQELEIKQRAQDLKEQGGAFGNSERGKHWATLTDAVKKYKAGDTSAIDTPEYRAAWATLGKDQVTKDALGNVSTVPGMDMSWAPAPTFNATGAEPQPKKVEYVEGQALKPLPEPALKGITNNLVSVSKIDDALSEVKNNPDAAIGTKMSQITRLPLGAIPTDVLDRLDPKGQKLRQLIGEISAIKVHDLSGAAVTAAEYPRLAPFIPRPTDSPEIIKSKLGSFKKALAMELRLQRGNIGKGSIVPPELEKYKGQTEATYQGRDGKPVSWKEIEDTAKARGIKVEQVIETLGLTPGE